MLDRLLAAYPVVLLYLVLSVLYGWQASRHSTPSIFSDELQWAELSRSVADTGHAALRLTPASPKSVYTYLIAPAWWLHGTEAAYAALKYIDVLVMTAALVPAYLLARMVASRPLALFAAAGTAMVPALIYSAMIVPEPLAYPYSTLCLYVVARALVRRTPGRIVLAILLCALAPAVRTQLAVLIPAAAFAAGVFTVTSERARRVVAGWSLRDWLGAVVLLLGMAIGLNALFTTHSISWQVGTHYSDRLVEYGLWAIGAFVIGVGVLPALAGLAWLLSGHRDPAQRAVQAVAAGALVAFGLYTAVKASYLSTQLAIRVEERNLIYLSPVAFVCAAAWLQRLRAALWAVAAATAGVAYVLATTPYNMDLHFYSDAPGLAVLSEANRRLAWNDGYAQNVLLWATAVAAAIVLAPIVVRRVRPDLLERRTLVRPAVAVVACAALAWSLTAQLAAASASNEFSDTQYANLPKPPPWVDARTGGDRTLYLGQRIDEQSFYPLEFWNQSIGEVWSLDATAPPPGPTVTPNLAKPDGTLIPNPPVHWAIGDNGVTFVGTPVEQHGSRVLFRVRSPLRITNAVSGVYNDGWTGEDASFAQYSSPSARPGVARVTVSRAGATGKEPPARVTIRLGTVRIDENGQPQIGRVLAVRHWTASGRNIRTFDLPARPPYRIELHVTPTFRPVDYGVPDSRALGVQVGHEFVSARP
jgi:hypothetical protein